MIGHVIPGFAVLWGVSYLSETVGSWLGSSPVNVPTVGGFLYVTIASIAAGLTVSSVRWLIVDTIHHLTGIRQPPWDFSRLQENITAYKTLIEIHYHFYLFYSGMVIALAFVYAARRLSMGVFSAPFGWIDIAFLVVGIAYFVTSRDNLTKYYTRVSILLGTEPDANAQIADCPNSNLQEHTLISRIPRHKLNMVHSESDRKHSPNQRENESKTQGRKTVTI